MGVMTMTGDGKDDDDDDDEDEGDEWMVVTMLVTMMTMGAVTTRMRMVMVPLCGVVHSPLRCSFLQLVKSGAPCV